MISGFAAISNRKGKIQTDLQKEVGSNEFTIFAYGGPKNARNRMQIWKKERIKQ